MKKKGFTLVELLVVIAIIALLMSILMPALARVRAIAFRMVCGSNLSGIGKAMLIYANDYDDEFPKGGGKSSRLVFGTGSTIPAWLASDSFTAFGLDADGAGGRVTLTSCLFLLIKYAEVTPKSFVCKGDSGTTEFKLSDEAGVPAGFELIQAWDFGTQPAKHCSYAYHQPLQGADDTSTSVYNYALTTSLSDPGMAVAADRNPWITTITADSTKFLVPGEAGNTVDTQKEGNSACHGTKPSEGQNVLFMDSHVYFEKRAYCGIDDDNIYTYWPTRLNTTSIQKKHGNPPVTNKSRAATKQDSFLLNNAQ